MRNDIRREIIRLDAITRRVFNFVQAEDLVIMIRDAKNLFPAIRTAISNSKNKTMFNDIDYIDDFVDVFLSEKKYTRDTLGASTIFNITKCYLSVYCAVVNDDNISVDDALDYLYNKLFVINK